MYLFCFLRTVLTRLAVGRTGYYLPWAVGGTGLTSISFGLLSTLNPTTSLGKWIGYQIIGGVGRGCSMQMVRPYTILPRLTSH